MKIFIALLLLTFLSPQSHAESIIPVSCDDVAQIYVNQALSSNPPIHVEDYPYVYLTTLRLKPEVTKSFSKFTDPNKIATIYPDGTRIEYRPFLLQTPAGIVVGDTPNRIHVNDKSILLIFKTREGALKAAQKVCPQIKPEIFFLYDYLEEKNRRNSKKG